MIEHQKIEIAKRHHEAKFFAEKRLVAEKWFVASVLTGEIRCPPIVRLARLFLFALFALLTIPLSAQDGDNTVTELKRHDSKHITLTTDIDDKDKISDLMAAFEAAVPQWTKFWRLPEGSLDDWKVDAYVIRNKATFLKAGLIPDSVPNFPFGYALGQQIFEMEQDSLYYTRHLLLHESVHALMFKHFGGAGPSWFMEGSAEMLSVHRLTGSDTQINQPPADRSSVPYWGRYKLMSERRKASGIPSLNSVIEYPRDLNSDVESYAWSWAATMMLYNYDDFRDAFYRAAKNGQDEDELFNVKLRRDLQTQWPVVDARWRLMCNDLNYGFDWSKEKVALSMKDQVWDGSELSIAVKPDQGWQSIGVRLNKGMKLNVTPSGQCVLGNKPKPWVSEPAGVTIRYHHGRPLGQLIACIVDNAPDAKSSDAKTIKPLPIASITKPIQIPIRENCWLLFRVNDAPGELADNTGAYQIKIQAGR